MTENPLLAEIDGDGVGWLTLNRPDVHNAFDDTLIATLAEALEGFGANPIVRAVVLTAAGRSFSAGADLNWMRRMAGFSFQQNVADAEVLGGLLRTLDTLPKPTVAMVQGPAFGGGVGLAAACDIVVAADTARFALTEVRLGLVPGTISPYVLAAIGARQARRYMVTGEAFDAAEAMRIGLVHRVVPGAALRPVVDEVLATLAGNGPEAMAATKEMIRAVAGRPVDDRIVRDTAERIARARASREAQTRITAFLDGRR